MTLDLIVLFAPFVMIAIFLIIVLLIESSY